MLVALAAGPLLASCVEATLPNFDGGVLNPEIRLLRAGEIVEGVKCAMVAFMHERENTLMDARKAAQHELDQRFGGRCPEGGNGKGRGPELCQIEGRYFGPYHINADKSVDDGHFAKRRSAHCDVYDSHLRWKPARNGWELECVPNRCDQQLVRADGKRQDLRMGRSVWDYTVVPTQQGFKEKGCAQVPDYSRLALDPNQTGTIQLTLSGVNSGFINYARIDAKQTALYPFIQPGNNATGAPFPQLFIGPRATTTFDISVVMPQSIHTYQQAAAPSDRIIERAQTRSGIPIGPSTDYSSSRKLAQPPKKSVMEAENLREKLSGIMTALEGMRHELLGQDKGRCDDVDHCRWPSAQPDATRKANLWNDWFENAQKWREHFKNADKEATAESDCEWARAFTRRDKAVEFACSEFQTKLYRLAAQLPFPGREESQTAGRKQLANEFYERCDADTSTFGVDNTTRIDFLRLKKLLHNVVEKQDDAIYRGVPDVTLSALTLTSAFQITMEAQAGTAHFFRIVPVLAPPNTELKMDHTHTLRISLNGKKGKGDRQNPKRLTESCRERVGYTGAERTQGAADGGRTVDTRDPCSTEYGQLLEAIIQAQEQRGGSQ